MTKPRRARGRYMILWMAALAAIVAAVSGGVTYAMWMANVSTSGAVITAGDVDMTVGQVAWQDTNGGSGSSVDSLNDLVAVPGDTVTLDVGVTGTFQGDNLAVSLSVGFASVSTATVAWHLEDASGAQVAPTSGDVDNGVSVLIPNATGSSGSSWTIVITITMPGSGVAWVDPASNPGSVDLGVLTLAAHQVRCGAGFTSACGAGGQ